VKATFGVILALAVLVSFGTARAWGPSPVFPSPAALASAATGTTAYTYVVVQSHTTSCGYAPSGTCLVMAQGDFVYPAAAPTAAGFLSPCIALSSTPSPLPTSIGGSYPAVTSAPCASSAPANALAGGAPFAMATTLPIYINDLSRHVWWNGTMPTNTTLTFLFEVEASSNVSETVQGSSSVVVIPF
jgi:hypothetical protein